MKLGLSTKLICQMLNNQKKIFDRKLLILSSFKKSRHLVKLNFPLQLKYKKRNLLQNFILLLLLLLLFCCYLINKTNEMNNIKNEEYIYLQQKKKKKKTCYCSIII